MTAKIDHQRKRRRAHRRAGLCLWCDRPALESLCEDHLAQQRARYEAAKAEGLCTKCGGPSDGGWACPGCREKINAARRARRAAR